MSNRINMGVPDAHVVLQIPSVGAIQAEDDVILQCARSGRRLVDRSEDVDTERARPASTLPIPSST